MRTVQQLFLWMMLCFSAVLSAAPAKIGFDEFIKGKVVHQGYFSFFHDEKLGKIYLEINQFEDAFLFQSALPHGLGSNDIGLDRGQLGDTRLVQFERVGNKVFLRQLNSYYRANTTNVLEQQAIDEAFASSIIWGFEIVNENKKANRVLIDYTGFLLSDIHQIAATLKTKKQGSYKIDLSRSGLYGKRIKAFPNNTEFEATITFKGSDGGEFIRSVAPDASAISVNMHHSLVKLPDDNYQPREFHPYSGYWPVEYADYASAIDEPLIKRLIPRHRLIKKHPQAKFSEAVEPIIYYLDAGVPEPIRSALLEGASWWNKAYEAIGYKNAFQVKVLPVDADPMDARYNVIQWVHRATRGWSYGSTITDPRTGEIIKGHVTLGSLRVRQDYLIALGLTSPFKSQDTDTSAMKEMALARIRQLSAHEVGHTLGAIHNFSASANDRASVMDYPHPLIELSNDKIDLSNAYSKDIGAWDKFVIAYGYSDVDKNHEKQYLAQLVANAQNQGLLYMADPDARAESTGNSGAHLWDNGVDAAKELDRVLKVRAKALANFGINAIPFGTPLSEIEQVLVPIYNFHRYQVEATAKLIGGVDYSYELRGMEKPRGVKIVSAKQQDLALTGLMKTLDVDLLTLPAHIIDLIPPKAYGYSRNRESFPSATGLTFDPVSAAEASAKHSLSFLLNSQRLARVQQQSSMNSYIHNVAEIITTLLKQTLYQRANQGLALLIQQRINQQVVEHLLTLWHQPQLVPEVRAEVYVGLTNLVNWLDDNHQHRQYKALSAQFSMLVQQINFSLVQGKTSNPVSKMSLPLGSPIGG